MKNGKKALAIVVGHASPFKELTITGLVQSRTIWEDYVMYVRKEKWRLHYSKNDEEPAMADTCFFFGFFSFLLVGPVVQENSLIHR